MRAQWQAMPLVSAPWPSPPPLPPAPLLPPPPLSHAHQRWPQLARALTLPAQLGTALAARPAPAAAAPGAGYRQCRRLGWRHELPPRPRPVTAAPEPPDPLLFHQIPDRRRSPRRCRWRPWRAPFWPAWLAALPAVGLPAGACLRRACRAQPARGLAFGGEAEASPPHERGVSRCRSPPLRRRPWRYAGEAPPA